MGVMRSTGRKRFLSRRGLMVGLMAAPLLDACAPTVVPAGPTVRTPILQEDALVSADGERLPVRHWPAEGKAARATILGLHGFGDYSAAFEEPAKAWSAAGIETWAWDQRGFGASPHRGRWAGSETMVADLRTMVALLRARNPERKLIAVGESMGATLLIVALGEPNGNSLALDGVVLAAPAARTRQSFGSVASGAFEVLAHLVPWLPVGPTSIDFHPSDNTEMLRKVARDPLMLTNPRTDQVYGLVNLMDEAWEAAPRVHRPALVLYGLGDGVVPRGPARALVERLPADAKPRIALYRNGYHMLFRDMAGAVVTSDVVAWVNNPDAGLPSGADRGPVSAQRPS